MIVYGGNTTSVGFAPAANDHAFLVGIDYDGNWMWGKFFYNVSYALSDISGCQMASDGLSLTLLGVSNSQPVVMDINTIDGLPNKFLSVEWTAMTAKNVPVFSTQGAVYYDKQDFYDGQQYIYWAFIMNNQIEMLRMLVSVTMPVIDWSYEFYLFTSSQASDLIRRQDPALMHIDPTDNSVIYLSGRYQGKGSVMKFAKRTGKMQWWASLKNVTSVRSIATVPA